MQEQNQLQFTVLKKSGETAIRIVFVDNAPMSKLNIWTRYIVTKLVNSKWANSEGRVYSVDLDEISVIDIHGHGVRQQCVYDSSEYSLMQYLYTKTPSSFKATFEMLSADTHANMASIVYDPSGKRELDSWKDMHRALTAQLECARHELKTMDNARKTAVAELATTDEARKAAIAKLARTHAELEAEKSAHEVTNNALSQLRKDHQDLIAAINAEHQAALNRGYMKEKLADIKTEKRNAKSELERLSEEHSRARATVVALLRDESK
jgi:hypothetical protein